VRRCLYYKAGKKLSRPPQHGAASWQRLLMQRLTAEWGWDHAKLARLDAQAGHNIHEVIAERNALVRELTLCYRFLSEFAREGEAGASIDAREFSILGRKLYAAYERRAGKVELLGTGGVTAAAEPEISICAVHAGPDAGAAQLWGAYPELVGSRGQPEQRALRQAPSLTELLSWCVLNGVIDERTRLAVREPMDGLRHAELEAMLREIRLQVLPARAAAVLDDRAFSSSARALALLAFVNVAADPHAAARASGLQRISSRTDALGYSALRENLVHNIETLVCNSWGEVVATRYSQEDGLLRCARDFLQMGELHVAEAAPVSIRCFCSSRAEPIAARIGELFTDLRDAFRPGPQPADTRYVLAVGTRLQLLRQQGSVVSSEAADGPEALLELLCRPLPAWSGLAVDRHALEGTPLPALAPRLKPGVVSVFCESRADGLQLIVADERGSLFRVRYPGLRESSALAALARFLLSVRYRRNAARGAAATEGPGAPRFYRLSREHGRAAYTAQPLAEAPRAGAESLHVQALAEPDAGTGSVLYTVWCEGESFSQRELGAGFHTALAARIRALRATGGDYPVYLTDLDLSALEAGEPAPLQTLHYLRHRQALEDAINASLQH
jgi:adenylate cyclase class 1